VEALNGEWIDSTGEQVVEEGGLLKRDGFHLTKLDKSISLNRLASLLRIALY